MHHRLSTVVAFMLVATAAVVAACGDASDPTGLAGRGNTRVDAPSTEPGAGGAQGQGGGTAPSATGTDDGGLAPVAASDASAPPPSGATCTACHGDPNRAAIAGSDPNLRSAPPRGTKGETAATTRAVGAHLAHVATADMRAAPIACNECHVVPTSTSHSNGKVDMQFGTLARTGNATPAWNGATCAASYCHGNFPGGNTAAAPNWTTDTVTCTSCHGAPPATGDHLRGAHDFACSGCHGTGYSATAVNKTLHINGVKNAGGPGSSITTWNPATRACTPTCHGTETW